MELLAGATLADRGVREVLICGDHSDAVVQTFGESVMGGEKDPGDVSSMVTVGEEASAMEREGAGDQVDEGETAMLMSKAGTQDTLQDAARAVAETVKANVVPSNADATQIILGQALGQMLGQTVSGVMAQPGGQPFLIPISLPGQLSGSQQNLLLTLPSGGFGDAVTAGGGTVGGSGGGAGTLFPGVTFGGLQLLAATTPAGGGGSGVQSALVGAGNAGGLTTGALNLAGIQTLGMAAGGGGGLVVLPLQTLQAPTIVSQQMQQVQQVQQVQQMQQMQHVVAQQACPKQTAQKSPALQTASRTGPLQQTVSIIPLMSLPPQATPQPAAPAPAPCQLQTATPQIVTNAQGQVVGVLVGNQLMPIAGPGTQLMQTTSHFLPVDASGQLYTTTPVAATTTASTPAPASNQVASPTYSQPLGVVGNQLITTAGGQLLQVVSSPAQLAPSPVKVAQKAGGCASVASPLKIVTASPVGMAGKPAKAIRNVPILKRNKQTAQCSLLLTQPNGIAPTQTAGQGVPAVISVNLSSVEERPGGGGGGGGGSGGVLDLSEAVDLEEIREFAKVFKLRRLALGLTQTQVGQALSAAEGPAYSQSAICRFEKLDLTPKSAQKMRPILERWMGEAEARHRVGTQTLTDFIGSEPSKRRKRRTSFTQQALTILNAHFEVGMHPTSAEMTQIAEQLGYDREVVRIWFCNKRQALKNTIKQIKHHQHVQQNFATSAQVVAVSAAAPATSVAARAAATAVADNTSNGDSVLVMEHDAAAAAADAIGVAADAEAVAGHGSTEINILSTEEAVVVTEGLGDTSTMEDGSVDGGGAGEEVSAEALMRALGKVV